MVSSHSRDRAVSPRVAWAIWVSAVTPTRIRGFTHTSDALSILSTTALKLTLLAPLSPFRPPSPVPAARCLTHELPGDPATSAALKHGKP